MAEEDLGTAALRDTFKFRTNLSSKGRQREADRSLERADRLNKIAATYDEMSTRRTNLLATQLKLRDAIADSRKATQTGEAAAAASQNVSKHLALLRGRESELGAMFSEGGEAAAKAYMAQTRRLANDPKMLVGYEIMGAQARENRDQVISNQQKVLEDLIADRTKQDATNIKFDNFLSIIKQDEDGNFVDDLSKDLQELLVFPDNLPPDVSTRDSALNLADKRVKSEIKSIASKRTKLKSLREDAARNVTFDAQKKQQDGPLKRGQVTLDSTDPFYLADLYTRYKELFRPNSEELAELLPDYLISKALKNNEPDFRNIAKLLRTANIKPTVAGKKDGKKDEKKDEKPSDFDLIKDAVDEFGERLREEILFRATDIEKGFSARAERLGEAVNIDPDLNPDQIKIEQGKGGIEGLTGETGE